PPCRACPASSCRPPSHCPSRSRTNQPNPPTPFPCREGGRRGNARANDYSPPLAGEGPGERSVPLPASPQDWGAGGGGGKVTPSPRRGGGWGERSCSPSPATTPRSDTRSSSTPTRCGGSSESG